MGIILARKSWGLSVTLEKCARRRGGEVYPGPLREVPKMTWLTTGLTPLGIDLWSVRIAVVITAVEYH